MISIKSFVNVAFHDHSIEAIEPVVHRLAAIVGDRDSEFSLIDSMFNLNDKLLIVDVEACPDVFGINSFNGEGWWLVGALVREQAFRVNGDEPCFPFL